MSINIVNIIMNIKSIIYENNRLIPGTLSPISYDFSSIFSRDGKYFIGRVTIKYPIIPPVVFWIISSISHNLYGYL